MAHHQPKEHNMRLFEYSAEIESIRAHINAVLDASEGEISDETELYLSALGGLVNDRAVKINHIANLITELEATSDARKAVAKRITARATAEAKKAERLRQYLAYNMQAGEKIDGMGGNVSCRETSCVVVDDLLLIPADLVRVETTADKTAIRKAIAEGHQILGAHIEQAKAISIR